LENNHALKRAAHPVEVGGENVKKSRIAEEVVLNHHLGNMATSTTIKNGLSDISRDCLTDAPIVKLHQIPGESTQKSVHQNVQYPSNSDFLDTVLSTSGSAPVIPYEIIEKSEPIENFVEQNLQYHSNSDLSDTVLSYSVPDVIIPHEIKEPENPISPEHSPTKTNLFLDIGLSKKEKILRRQLTYAVNVQEIALRRQRSCHKNSSPGTGFKGNVKFYAKIDPGANERAERELMREIHQTSFQKMRVISTRLLETTDYLDRSLV